MGSRVQDLGKLVLRLTLGALILLHGISKLEHGTGPIMNMVTSAGWPAYAAYGVLLGEVLGPVLLILGLFGRIGAALITLNMLVAIWLAHLPQLLVLNRAGGWQLELQGMYLFTAIALVLIGPGRLSLNGR